MRAWRALAFYLVWVFVGGALLAPWLYWIAQGLLEHSPVFHSLFQKLAGNPFHRFVNRSLLALAFVGLWPLARSLDIRSWSELGLVRPNGQGPRLVAGLLLGFASLAFVALLTLAVGARGLNSEMTPDRLARKLCTAAASAVVVALLEEVLFRGALFGGLRKACRWQLAMIVSSVLYASVHFFGRSGIHEEIRWTTGFTVLGQMLRGVVDVDQAIPGILNLTLAGALLAMARQRTESLYFSIGLHAGWIFWLKSYGLLTRDAVGGSVSLWGSGRLIDGWLALAVLACCWPAAMRLTTPGKPSAHG